MIQFHTHTHRRIYELPLAGGNIKLRFSVDSRYWLILTRWIDSPSLFGGLAEGFTWKLLMSPPVSWHSDLRSKPPVLLGSRQPASSHRNKIGTSSMSSGYLTHHQQAPDAPQFDLPTTNSPRSQLARRKGSKTRERVRSLIVTYAKVCIWIKIYYLYLK